MLKQSQWKRKNLVLKMNYIARNLFPFLSMEERYKGCLRNIFAPQYSKRQIQNTRLYILTQREGSRSRSEKAPLPVGLCTVSAAGRSAWESLLHKITLSTSVQSLLSTAHLSNQVREYKFFFAEISVLVTYVQHIIRMSW